LEITATVRVAEDVACGDDSRDGECLNIHVVHVYRVSEHLDTCGHVKCGSEIKYLNPPVSFLLLFHTPMCHWLEPAHAG